MNPHVTHVSELLFQELMKVRLIGANKLLRPFLHRLETWELLLMVHMLSGDGRYGIEDYLEKLQTLKCTRLTMRNFIRDRIAEGTFIVVEGDKKSRKCLELSADLRSELEDCFETLKEAQPFRTASEPTRPFHTVEIPNHKL